MARLYGRAPRGQRCVASVPHGHWMTTTFTGALRKSGLTAPMVMDGPMNGPAFRAYVEQVLVPTLSPGDSYIVSPRKAKITFTSVIFSEPAAILSRVEPSVESANSY